MTCGKALSLLVVEDDSDIRFAVSLMLESEGYAVKVATNGKEALALLERDGLPHLILLDMLMPVMDGWHFAEEFRARYGHRVPILVMTAASDAAQRAREIQAEGFVSKPFSVDSFLAAVRQQVKEWEIGR